MALPNTQKGVAVITALLLTTLAVTIVASLFWQQQVQVRSIENQRLQLQKQWILRGALDWASLILREDAKHSSVDTLDEPWAVSLAETHLDEYVEEDQSDAETINATLSGSISDAQAQLNLNNLCVKGIINPAEVAAFERLLSNKKIDVKFAQATADIMADSQKLPSNPTQKNATQPLSFFQVDDLLAVDGLTPTMLDLLRPYVIFLPEVTLVNVNTAPMEVLSAKLNLSLSDAATLIKSRDNATFKDIADLNSRSPNKALNALANQAVVTTNYFLVNGEIKMGRASLNMQALINRNAGQTKLVWIR